MKKTIKEAAHATIISIGMSMAIFCIIGIVFDVRFGGNFSLENYQFTRMVVGWIGNHNSVLQNAVIVLVQLVVAFILWCFFMIYYKKEAQKMNEKLQTMKK